MARSFANVKIFSSLVQDGISNALTRRGYAVASQSGATSRGVASIRGNKSGGEEKSVISSSSPYKVSWVPDPVTGYYKPENINEVDAAELRATLLGKKLNN